MKALFPRADKFTGDQVKAFLEKTVQSDYSRKIFDGIIAKNGTAVVEKATTTEQGDG